jgi:hypothetical protein
MDKESSKKLENHINKNLTSMGRADHAHPAYSVSSLTHVLTIGQHH